MQKILSAKTLADQSHRIAKCSNKIIPFLFARLLDFCLPKCHDDLQALAYVLVEWVNPASEYE